MPYTGPSDTKLPDYVKSLTITKRRQWVRVWNSAYAKCQARGGEDCEATAFKTANGVVGMKTEELEQSLNGLVYSMREEIFKQTEKPVIDIYLEHSEFGSGAILEDGGKLLFAPFALGDSVEVSRPSEWREVVRTYKFAEELEEEPEEEPEQPSQAIPMEVAEAISGHVVGVVEAGEGSAEDPLVLEIMPIHPGWGNSRDNFYYPIETLREYAHVWQGAKMYTTDHRMEEKSVRTEVSQVLESPSSFTEEGIPLAKVGIFDPQFARMVRNRAKLGILEGLHCSILGSATAGDAVEENGRRGRKIVAFHPEGANIDWVTQAGAGGKAQRIMENEPMEEKVVETEEVKIQESVDTDVVLKIISESKLPETARARLTKLDYVTEDEVKEAISAEIEYIKEVTESGKPKLPTAVPVKVTPAEVQERQDEVLDKWFNRRVK